MSESATTVPTANDTRSEAVESFRARLHSGVDWPEALLQAMSLWSAAEEEYRGRAMTYFICGEAFAWLLLAERMLDEARDLVPSVEMEALILDGAFPERFDAERMQHLLGVEKYRGFLNYRYGVTVEEALQLACELELRKRDASNGVRYRQDYAEMAFARIYRKPRAELLGMFRGGRGGTKKIASMAEHEAFTYWLFKYRWENSDKARVASDTAKGLRQLDLMERQLRRRRTASPALA